MVYGSRIFPALSAYSTYIRGTVRILPLICGLSTPGYRFGNVLREVAKRILLSHPVGPGRCHYSPQGIKWSTGHAGMCELRLQSIHREVSDKQDVGPGEGVL